MVNDCQGYNHRRKFYRKPGFTIGCSGGGGGDYGGSGGGDGDIQNLQWTLSRANSIQSQISHSISTVKLFQYLREITHCELVPPKYSHNTRF
jgi:hypothetical protein